MFCYAPSNPHFARVVVRDDEIKTVNGLAFDLDDVDYMRERGVPISSQALQSDYYDGDVTPSDGHDDFFVPPERCRLVDINDVWNMSKDARKKVTNAKIVTTQTKNLS